MKAEQIGIFFAATNESAPCNGFFVKVTQLLRRERDNRTVKSTVTNTIFYRLKSYKKSLYYW